MTASYEPQAAVCNQSEQSQVAVSHQPNIKHQARQLAKFYAGKSVLITGATGFIGKVCLVKLFTSLSHVRSVYVLMRSKKGSSSEQRFNRLLAEEPFCSIRDAAGNRPDWSKVRAVDGDMSKENLGLSSADLEEVQREVEIVINLAASVQFDAPLKQNLQDNYLGARNLLEMSCSFQRLVSFVHVSTFYSNSHLSHIEEKIEPLKRNHEQLAQLITLLPEEMCANAGPDLMESRPNTYVLTKAMAENLVKSYENRLPIAIVRPSIVVPSNREPQPGWVDNVNGPMGLGMLAAIGILRNIDWNYWGVADLIPVDMVANTILAVAERTPRLAQNELVVYNCSSSSLNPVTWGGMFEVLRDESLKAPPYKMIRMPISVPKHKRANKLGFAFTKLSELLFAYIIDTLLTLCGQKRLLVRLTAKLHHGYEILRPFTTTEYTCTNKNLEAAFQELVPEDRDDFDFDVAKINWESFFKLAYHGSRVRLLKEDINNLPAARRKMYMLMVFEHLVRFLMLAFFGWTIYKLYGFSPLPVGKLVN